MRSNFNRRKRSVCCFSGAGGMIAKYTTKAMMNEREIAFWTLVVTVAGVVIAFVGIIFALLAIRVAINTLRRVTRWRKRSS